MKYWSHLTILVFMIISYGQSIDTGNQSILKSKWHCNDMATNIKINCFRFPNLHIEEGEYAYIAPAGNFVDAQTNSEIPITTNSFRESVTGLIIPFIRLETNNCKNTYKFWHC